MLVKNEGEFIYHGEGLRLVPGTNAVNADHWKAFIKIPLNQHLVDDGVLIPVEDIDGKAKTLADMTNSEISAMLRDTHDLQLLADLGEEEAQGKNRKGVLEAITKQAESVQADLDKAKTESEQN